MPAPSSMRAAMRLSRNTRARVCFPSASLSSTSSSHNLFPQTVRAASTTTSRILQLSAQIAAKTAVVDEYINKYNLPHASFAPDAPTEFPSPGLEGDGKSAQVLDDVSAAKAAHAELVKAVDEMKDLVEGPKEKIRSVILKDLFSPLVVQAIYHYRIAHAFPPGESITYEDLTSKSGLPVKNLRRLIYHATTLRIFAPCPVSPITSIVHTPASALLAKNPFLEALTGFMLEDVWKAAAHVVDAMDKWPGSEEPNQSGFQHAWQTEETLFKALSSSKSRIERFGKGMKGIHQGSEYAGKAFVEAYPWEKIPEGGTVVDIGGGVGHTTFDLADTHSHLNYIVQDLPPTIATAKATPLPPQIADKVQFEVHDFFKPQPVHGADVYFSRFCFHNWSDKYALQMLRSLIPALKKGARVVINDGVLPIPDAVNGWKAEEKHLISMDLIMLSIVNARERDVEGWRELFREADPGFRFLGATKPKGNMVWIMEAVWDPEGDVHVEWSAAESTPKDRVDEVLR
ncbi:S-adenosyl-L-methionine-dependent methyltransferase [Aulographum hederae CBS 113979]|uniref:S-adenosyl-L-methionine-dependent methyltransferase n=1 Tax=Aulographum hederae CBS 113979 TaxID=1176131 RepID=A0A6G1HGH8_9PEZI|nr:S-adenosyl-L-methionine-dependent methyltransferase [Aulographum hederae CBS 113979]